MGKKINSYLTIYVCHKLKIISLERGFGYFFSMKVSVQLLLFWLKYDTKQVKHVICKLAKWWLYACMICMIDVNVIKSKRWERMRSVRRLGHGEKDRKKRSKSKKRRKKKLFRHENRNTVEPRSNGIVFITDSYSWSLQIGFFYFLCWQ